MVIKRVSGVFCGAFERGVVDLNEEGDAVIGLIPNPRAGRRLRAEYGRRGREKRMTHPFSDGRFVDVAVRDSLKWFRRKFHKVERQIVNVDLTRTIQTGGYRADIVNPWDLVPIHAEPVKDRRFRGYVAGPKPQFVAPRYHRSGFDGCVTANVPSRLFHQSLRAMSLQARQSRG